MGNPGQNGVEPAEQVLPQTSPRRPPQGRRGYGRAEGRPRKGPIEVTPFPDGQDDDNQIVLPDLKIRIPLPEWFGEMKKECDRAPPDWVGAGGRDREDWQSPTKSATNHHRRRASLQAIEQAEAMAEKLKKMHLEDGMPKPSESPAVRLTKLFVGVIFAVNVHKSASESLDGPYGLVAKKKKQFKDASQLQMLSCVSWLTRCFHVFYRTLINDSSNGLVLVGKQSRTYCSRGSKLTPQQRLVIRVSVLLDLFQLEPMPDPMAIFFKLFAPRNLDYEKHEQMKADGVAEETWHVEELERQNKIENMYIPQASRIIYLPEDYLTQCEKEYLCADKRNGVYSAPGSKEHELLVVSFVLLRALMGKLLAGWCAVLAADEDVDPNAVRNIQAVSALLLCVIQMRYQMTFDLKEAEDRIPGLTQALGKEYTEAFQDNEEPWDALDVEWTAVAELGVKMSKAMRRLAGEKEPDREYKERAVYNEVELKLAVNGMEEGDLRFKDEDLEAQREPAHSRQSSDTKARPSGNSHHSGHSAEKKREDKVETPMLGVVASHA